MQQDEQDTCRICSAPAEPDQPLFHPCKCSGTIRYIHQDCLTTWLAHSRKKTCDVCKHPYTFAKVYDPNMPKTLPPLLVIRRATQQVFFFLVFVVRAIFVGFIWLALLPWVTMWTWRMYFLMGDSTAWWIADRPRPSILDSLLRTTNATTTLNASTLTLPANTTLFTRVTSHPAWSAASSDIFGGQIVASAIIIGFVAVFLLQEWIQQNARPEGFEDVDPPPAIADDPPVLEMPEPELEPQPQPAPVDDARLRIPPLTSFDGFEDTLNAYASPTDGLPDGSDPETKVMDYLKQTAAAREADQSEERRVRKPRRRGVSRVIQQSDQVPPPSQPVSGSGLPSAFEFTFESGSASSSPDAPKSALPHTSDLALEPSVPWHDVSLGLIPRRSSSEPPGAGSPPSPVLEGTRFAYQPESSNPSNSRTSPTSPPWPTTSDLSRPTRPLPQRIPNFPRRPPLPASAMPSPVATPAIGYPNGTSPLASPSVASYQAPEELETGVRGPLPGSMSPVPSYQGKGKARATTPDWIRADESNLLHNETLMLRREQNHYFKLADEELATNAPKSPISDQEDQESDHGRVPPTLPAQASLGPMQPPSLVDEEDDNDDDNEGDDEEGLGDLDAGHAPFAEPWDGEEPDVERARLVEEVDRMEAELRELQRERAELEQLEAMVEEDGDFDGVFEVIGFRGRMSTVFQNVTLVTFALDTAIGLGVWLPFMVGKSTALLSLDPPRLLYVILTPVRIMRLITDPGVDNIEEMLLFPLARFARVLISSLSYYTRIISLNLIAKAFGAGSDIKAQEYAEYTYYRVQEELHVAWANTVPTHENGSTVDGLTEGFTIAVDNVLQSNSDVIRWAEPHFAELGKRVRLFTVHGQTKWTQLALGDGPQEKMFAIALGYAVFAFLLALYLNILTMGTMRSAGRAVRSTIQQQLLVVKVGIFVLVEVVAFPLGCGIVLDLATLWLCPSSTLNSRKEFTFFAPTTSAFYHWLLGTVFMYQFAIILNGCRRIMRPGALWFIKDPQDQNFHPIRDIIERSSFTQIRKLLLSAEMYVVVITAGVATVGGFLWVSPLLPFRWRIREPLSDVPVDLVVLIVLMPYTMRFLRPSKPLRRWTRRIWRRLSAQLRLSSYMFGKRYPLEEFTTREWSLASIFTVHEGMEVQDSEAMRDGGFRRVPASDSVMLEKNVPGVAQVDEFGNPLDQRNSRVMQLQDSEALRTNRDVHKDYTVVYVPPYFRLRLICFIALLWIIGSAFTAAVITFPTLLGRAAFTALVGREVHDGYSFLAGFYLLWGAWAIGKSLDRMDKRRQRERDWEGPKAHWAIWVIKRVLRWCATISYLVFTLGFVLPTLVALVVELYIVLPLRLTINPALPVRIRIVDMWMLGILYTKILLRTRRMQVRSPLMRGIDRIMRNGWTHPDSRRATEEVIGPIIGGTLAMIIAPITIVTTAKFCGFGPISDKFLLMHVYPGMFATAGLTSSVITLAGSWESWAQGVREKEFLLEMQLQNLEPTNGQGSNKLMERVSETQVLRPIAEAGGEAVDSEEDDEEDAD